MARALILLLMLSLPLNGQQAAGTGSYSREKEDALGAALARDVRRQAHPLASATVQQYVADLGRLLATQRR